VFIRSPTAGGQYHWVSEFSPRWCQKYLSYITGRAHSICYHLFTWQHRTGWLLAAGWQGSVVGLSFLAGTIIQGLIILNDASYVPHQWHGTLLVIAVVTFCIIFNTSLAQKLPLIEGLVLLLHVIGLFAIIVPLWVLAPRNSAEVALLQFNNGGNWSSVRVAFMIGLLTPLGSMMGFDVLCICVGTQPSPNSSYCQKLIFNSRRSQRCVEHSSKSFDVGSRSQCAFGLSYSYYAVLHHHRSCRSPQWQDWVPLHSALLQCHTQLRWRQRYDCYRYHRPCLRRRQWNRDRFSPNLVFC